MFHACSNPLLNLGVASPAPHWVRGMLIQLMVTREVNSRTAKAGDRIALRVNAPIAIDGRVVIPEGAPAFAEVDMVAPTKTAGGAGKLGLRLLYVDTAWGHVALTGNDRTQGSSNADGVLLGVFGFGILGLLNKGHNAVFKAGDLIAATIDQGETPVPVAPTGT